MDDDRFRTNVSSLDDSRIDHDHTSVVETTPASSVISVPSIFNSPIPPAFSAGPSTPSITIDIPASASPSNSPRPLAALPSASNPSRRAFFSPDGLGSNSSAMPNAEKSTDDPSNPVDSRRSLESRGYTPTSLSKLFAGSTASPSVSREPSFSQAAGPIYPRSYATESATLPMHLYQRGLLQGRHSDITVVAFGTKYALHRIILDRAPFFTTALSEPWLESSAKEISLHPEEIDSNITQAAFELALKRLYGCDITDEEQSEAIGLFATGCWLEMQDLVDSSINAILRRMNTKNLPPLIKLVTTNYYGRAGERILTSAKAMLCRDGWEMPLRYWDGIPGEIIREVVGADGFFVNSEWERWILARRLLNRRLKRTANELGLAGPGKPATIHAPDALGLMAVRFDTFGRKNTASSGQQTPRQGWLGLYTHPDIEPLLALLDEGIHYIHLEFEQLQLIRTARDSFGLPLMPEKVISKALWMQMELRQKVLNACETDMELGLSIPAEQLESNNSSHPRGVISSRDVSKTPPGKRKIDEDTHMEEAEEEEDEEAESGGWGPNGRPRKFWIPSADCNIVMGGNTEPIVTTSNTFQRHASRLSATLQQEDVQWATTFAASPAADSRFNGAARPGSSAPGGLGQPKPIACTHFPPFRFAAEFPNPRLLKEKKRVYSRTVFYAGSLWNIYIQKVRSAKSAQLGVYLHRAKEREAEEVLAGVSASISSASLAQGSVDERIGLLEREMILGRNRDLRRRSNLASDSATTLVTGPDEDTSGSGGDPDITLMGTGSGTGANRSLASLFSRRAHRVGSARSQLDLSFSQLYAQPLSSTQSLNFPGAQPASSPPTPDSSDSDDWGSECGDYVPPTPRRRTLPPYVDARPTIKTYFKIYSPSKGGRLLSVYESAPDRFNFSQSWGWKSSTLMLDEGMGVAPEAEPDVECDDGVTAGARKAKPRSEGRLRFMVVVGNL